MRFILKHSLLLPIIGFALLLSACNASSPVQQPHTDKSPDTISGFVWHDLISDNLKQSQAFYSALFGWELLDARRADGRQYKLIKHQGRYIGGMLQLDDPENGDDYSRWLGYLSVADIDTALSNTEATSGKILVAAKTIQSIGRAAAISDPQGAVVGLISSDIKPPGSTSDAPGNIVWDELLSKDPNAAADFYQVLSGLSIDDIQRRGGHYYMLKSHDQARAGIVENPFEQSSDTWLSYFSVENVEQSTQLASTLGAKILISPSQNIRKATLALIADPNGALLVLEQGGTGAKQTIIQ